ncbi:RHS repeat domain-containing protein [Massilia sp. TWP1-3-3]|uniref:RHS repeat domain-containing protein n=1 Tax=Massilia sp. TWP1-3-3 TaxID=2804573 RepID=UPI003CF162FF
MVFETALPSEVTDRFGNWVRYTYDPANPKKLLSIYSNDNRRLDFEYTDTANPDSITAIKDGVRTWRYTYVNQVLSQVILPDLSFWQVLGIDNLSGVFKQSNGSGCAGSSTELATTRTATLTHPSGATGAFTLKAKVHGRANVPTTCLDPNNYVDNDEVLVPMHFQTLALTSKVISGPGLQPMQWTYAYPAPMGSLTSCVNCPTSKSISVTDPGNAVTRYTFGIQYGRSEGRIEQVDVDWNGSSALRTTQTSYRAVGAGPYPVRAGNGALDSGDSYQNSLNTPVDRITTFQQGDTFTWAATGWHAIFPRATVVSRQRGQDAARTETTEYKDFLPKWVIGAIDNVTVAGIPGQLVKNTYDDATGVLLSSSQYGAGTQTFAYNPNGTLLSRADGKGQKTTFSNYIAGIPQNIVYPDQTGESAVVAPIGFVLSSTNAANQTTTYEPDSMWRVSKVNYPAGVSGDPASWAPMLLSFSPVNSDEYGIAPGHWRQEIQIGNSRERTYFDALLRPVFTEKWDIANAAATKRIVKSQYDYAGKTTFTSYPKRDVGSLLQGVYQEYDALGRPTITRADSQLGILQTTNSYLSGFVRQSTDPIGNITTSAFQAFDQPAEGAISSIAAPLGVNVVIARDLLGKPTSITRSGGGKSATRSYVYDSGQRLCKTIEPESGATVQTYDSADNVLWRASGLNLYATSCDAASVTADKKISYGYDARNRLLTTSYADSSPDITRTYWPVGSLKTINSGGANWTYTYNSRGMSLSESLSYASSTYAITRTYDGNGALTQLKYPDNTVVDYSPNALGEPTKVGAYATAVSYFPNGAIERFVFGNGIVHSLTQNVQGLPERSIDAGVLNDVYTYDLNGNVKSVVDAQQGVTNRTMEYDALDRLKRVYAPAVWADAYYSYDALDNLIASNLTGGSGIARTMTHQYDAANRLSSITGTAGFAFGYTYDSQGNIIQRGSQIYAFDQGNRMKSAAGKGTYLYDGLGRRMSIVGTDGVNRVSVYSQAGQLLYVTPTNGAGTKYIYLHNHQIAEVKP